MLNSLIAILAILPVPLTEGLGAKSYRVRNTSHSALISLGAIAVPALERCASSHPNLEVRARCQVLLRPFTEELAERDSHSIMPSNWPRLPWLCEYYDWNGDGVYPVMHRFMSEARERMSDGGKPDWPEYRFATRLWIKSQLIQRRPISEIRRELDWMATEESGWIRINGKNYLPPIELPKGYK